jgi:hypothetical protein
MFNGQRATVPRWNWCTVPVERHIAKLFVWNHVLKCNANSGAAQLCKHGTDFRISQTVDVSKNICQCMLMQRLTVCKSLEIHSLLPKQIDRESQQNRIFISIMRSTYPVHLMLLHFIIRIIFDEVYKLWNSHFPSLPLFYPSCVRIFSA